MESSTVISNLLYQPANLHSHIQSSRPSQLRQPSRILSPDRGLGKGLAEISDSQSNVRSFASKMPPPKSIKHKLAGTCRLP